MAFNTVPEDLVSVKKVYVYRLMTTMACIAHPVIDQSSPLSFKEDFDCSSHLESSSLRSG